MDYLILATVTILASFTLSFTITTLVMYHIKKKK